MHEATCSRVDALAGIPVPEFQSRSVCCSSHSKILSASVTGPPITTHLRYHCSSRRVRRRRCSLLPGNMRRVKVTCHICVRRERVLSAAQREEDPALLAGLSEMGLRHHNLQRRERVARALTSLDKHRRVCNIWMKANCEVVPFVRGAVIQDKGPRRIGGTSAVS